MQCKDWLKSFNSILHKSFKKVKIQNDDSKRGVCKELVDEHTDLKKKLKVLQTEEEKEEVEERIKEVEENIGDDLANEYKNEIISTINKFGGDSKRLTGSGRNKVWQVIKKKFTKQAATIPVGEKRCFWQSSNKL